MKITNPTNEAIAIQYRGADYRVDAMSTIQDVPEEAAIYWRDMIHNFIIVSSDSATVAPKKVIEIPEEIVMSREEMVDMVGEEEVAKIEAETEVSEVEAVIVPSTKKGKK